MKNSSEKHQFSFYYPQLVASRTSVITITEPVLVHRLYTIMRYQAGDSCILFNKECYTTAIVQEISKKQVILCCNGFLKTESLAPEIILFLPLLKKESLEQAVYNAVVAGVTTIQLLITDKCHKKTIIPSDYQRLEKIAIAAAEQSKYYTIPSIHQPLTLSNALQSYQGYELYYADFTGTSLQPLKNKSIIMIGPEGDLTADEKEVLKKHKAFFFILTPTVLRSQEAVLVALAYARMLT